ncbi:MAG TPA: O-antigen polymerase [Candidatus Acidoferrum sp.]|nr:O-antigen polymerase [Candidatus Acidoferrum sp.]
MVLNKCLALLFSVMILGQAYLVRRHVGTWLFPSCIFGLFWFGYTFFPLAVLFWVPVQPYGVAFIFICTVAFSMAAMVFDWKTAFERNAQKRGTATVVYGNSFLKALFYISTISSLLFLALNSFAQGFSLRDLLFDLYASAAAYAEMRYSQDLSSNAFNPLSIIFTYMGVILGGLLFPSMETKIGRCIVLVLSFLPSILVAVTQSAKGLLFLCVVFFYAGLLVYRASEGTLRLFKKGNIKWLMIFMAVLISTVTISFVSGGLYKIEDVESLAGELISRFATYALGHLYAFSDWFAFVVGIHSDVIYSHEGATHGFYTFAPLFKLLGSHKVLPLGNFDDIYSFGDLINTNIFTMFRGLIQDFGIIGSVLFMLLTGFLFHWAFRTMLLKRVPVFTVGIFVLMMGYFYLSFGISLLISNSIYVTFFLTWIILQSNKLIAERSGRLLPRSQVPTIAAAGHGILQS